MARYTVHMAGGRKRKTIYGKTRAEVAEKLAKVTVGRDGGLVGESIRLVPSWRNGPFGVEMAGEILLPGPGARLAPTTFDAWLAER